MLQDIYPHIYHNEYRRILPSENDSVLLYEKSKVLLRLENGEVHYPVLSEVSTLNLTFYFLFSIDDKPYFLGLHDPFEESPLTDYHFEDLRFFRSALPKHTAFAGVIGHQLYAWYLSNKYCGCCQTEMEPDTKERMLKCPSCGHMVYPKISPAVIVAITDKNRILMSKYQGRSYKNYALIAGFAEIGETIEETVHREVMEEVGLKVKNLTYYKSQPWGFTDTLLLGFFCELDGDDAISLDENELSEADWYEAKDIDLEDDSLSLTREMILEFKKRVENHK